MSSGYRYPDRDDLVFSTYLQTREPYPGYWLRSESYAWHQAERILIRRAHGRLLDFGCGSGRLLPRFAPFFCQTTAIELDPERARAARQLVSQTGLNNVKVLVGGVETLERELAPFDVVICSHVLQHVSTADLHRILAAIREALKHDGLLVLCVPLRGKGEPPLLASRVHCGRLVTRFPSPEEFESLVSRVGEIPARLFSLAELDTMLRPDFRVLKTWMHCDMRPVSRADSFIFRDHLINLPLLRGRFGRNVLLVARLVQ